MLFSKFLYTKCLCKICGLFLKAPDTNKAACAYKEKNKCLVAVCCSRYDTLIRGMFYLLPFLPIIRRMMFHCWVAVSSKENEKCYLY